jgi:hypothetical protein
MSKHTSKAGKSAGASQTAPADVSPKTETPDSPEPTCQDCKFWHGLGLTGDCRVGPPTIQLALPVIPQTAGIFGYIRTNGNLPACGQFQSR